MLRLLPYFDWTDESDEFRLSFLPTALLELLKFFRRKPFCFGVYESGLWAESSPCLVPLTKTYEVLVRVALSLSRVSVPVSFDGLACNSNFTGV